MFGKQPSRRGEYRALARANLQAAKLEADATRESTRVWEEHQAQVREDFKPWREAGLQALSQIQQGYEDGSWENGLWKSPTEQDLKFDPGYNFRLKEGNKALLRSQNARGGVSNAASIKAGQRWNQGNASAEYGNAYSRALTEYGKKEQARSNLFTRLNQTSGDGANATAQVTATGNQATSNIGNNIIKGASSLAKGKIGAANARLAGAQDEGARKIANWNTFQGNVESAFNIHQGYKKGLNAKEDE